MTEEDPVLTQVVNGVATVTLNRPTHLNAINGRLSRALNRAIDQASRSSDVRVIVITGAGRGFSSGADLKVLDEIATAGQESSSGAGKLRYGTLLKLPKPVIAAVNGPCAGVAVGLACCADIRLASSTAFFVTPFAQLGLCAEVGLGWLLPRLMGNGSSFDMLWSGRRVPAEEAHRLGLVSRVFPPDTFLADVQSFAETLAAMSPWAMSKMKTQIYEGWNSSFEQAEHDAHIITEESYTHHDFNEALRSRIEKRAPIFDGLSSEFISH